MDGGCGIKYKLHQNTSCSARAHGYVKENY
jgi:hypothetical protein